MSAHTIASPRWGDEKRDRKAATILSTLKSAVGDDVISGSWLDVGCGSGSIANHLANHVATVTGIDPEPWSHWAELTASQSNLSFLAGVFDADDLPVEDGSFDVIVCNQVYEHVDDPELLLRNIYRALKPGGYCYFAGPNLLWPIEPHVYWPFVHWVPRRLAQAVMRALGSRRADELDAWSMDYWRLTALFERTELAWSNMLRERFSSERSPGCLGRAVRSTACLPGWLFRLFAPLSPGFVFLLRKP